MQIELAAVKTLAKRRRRVTRLFSRSEEPQLQPQCKRNIGIVRPQRCASGRQLFLHQASAIAAYI